MQRKLIILTLVFAGFLGLIVYGMLDGPSVADDAFSGGILLWVFATTVKNEINISKIQMEIKELKERGGKE